MGFPVFIQPPHTTFFYYFYFHFFFCPLVSVHMHIWKQKKNVLRQNIPIANKNKTWFRGWKWERGRIEQRAICKTHADHSRIRYELFWKGGGQKLFVQNKARPISKIEYPISQLPAGWRPHFFSWKVCVFSSVGYRVWQMNLRHQLCAWFSGVTLWGIWDVLMSIYGGELIKGGWG